MSTLKVNAIRGTGASSDAISVNSTDGTCTAKITNPPPGNRNLIIGGAMNVAQRGTSSTGVGYVTVDRFYTDYGGENEACTFAQVDVSTGTTPYTSGFRKALKVTNGNQTGGAGAGDYTFIRYIVEAQDLATSGWDYTSASSYITLSFWVKCSVAGLQYGFIQSGDGTAQGYSFSLGNLSANTWTKVTAKIPGNSNLTINNDNGAGMYIHWGPYWGTNYTDSGNTLNTWAAWNASSRTPDFPTTWWTTNDATFEITGVQLEVGDVATDFEHRSYDAELQRCYRYYEQFNSNGLTEAMFASGYFESTGRGRHCLLYNRKRATPTITASAASTFMNLNTNAVPAGDTITIKKPTETSAEFQLEAGSSGTDGEGCCLASKDSTEATIKISAEL